jgi:hypothetical protein
VCKNYIAWNPFWPVAALLDECCHVDAPLFQFNKSLQDTKTAVKNNYLSRAPNGPGRSNPTVLPRLSNSFGPWPSFGSSLPATNSKLCRILKTPHTIVWYLFPNGQGFLGTNMYPWQVYLFAHVDINLSRHEVQPGEKFPTIFSFQAWMSFRISKNLSQCVGGASLVYLRQRTISSKWQRDI